MDKEKLIIWASYMAQLALDLIREHRRECGLDPVLFPDDKWMDDAQAYFLSGLEFCEKEVGNDGKEEKADA